MGKTKPPPAGPIVCRPLGQLPLREVPGFPPEVADRLELVHGVVTLLDLEPHVREVSITAAQTTPVGPVRETLAALDVPDAELDQATWALIRHLTASTAPPPPEKPKPAKVDPTKYPDTARGIYNSAELGELVAADHRAAALAAGCPEALVDYPVAKIPGLTAHVVKTLARKCEITELGELWDWVEEDGSIDGGMSSFNGIGLFGCLRSIGISARAASDAGDTVYQFLREQEADPRPANPPHGAQVRLPHPHKVIPDEGDANDPAGDPALGTRSGPRGSPPDGPSSGGPLGGSPSVGDQPGAGGSVGAVAPTPGRGGSDDFDEATPPPKRRPPGEPLPRIVKLRTLEPVAEHFAAWDKAGRIPPGSVLLEHVGTCCGLERHGGYKVVATRGGWPVGRLPSVADLERARTVSMVSAGGRSYVVAVPA